SACSALFPYTTLFRSLDFLPVVVVREGACEDDLVPGPVWRSHHATFVVIGIRDLTAPGLRRNGTCFYPFLPTVWSQPVGFRSGKDRKSTRLNSSHVKI